MGQESGESLQRPEGRLIARALQRKGISSAAAAAAAEISAGRWGALVRGYCVPVKDLRVPLIAPTAVLARMAVAAEATAAELREAGRPDAAALLEGPG